MLPCHGLQWVHAAVHTIISKNGPVHSSHVHAKQAIKQSQPHLNYLDYSMALLYGSLLTIT